MGSGTTITRRSVVPTRRTLQDPVSQQRIDIMESSTMNKTNMNSKVSMYNNSQRGSKSNAPIGLSGVRAIRSYQ